ncbi:unnamed protein product, partial [Timema podura]|nr:unnamed protein product [Timema podura]
KLILCHFVQNQHWPCTIEMSINKEMFVSNEVTSKNSLKKVLRCSRAFQDFLNVTEKIPNPSFKMIFDDPGYQIMNEDEIVSYLQDSDELSDDEEDECGNIPSKNESGSSNYCN